MVGGKPISRRKDLDQEGYTFDDQTKTLSIRHTSCQGGRNPGKERSAAAFLHHL